MADTNTTTTSNGWLDRIFNTGVGLFGTITQRDQAQAEQRSATRIAEANAQAEASKSSATTKALIIGGAILAAILVIGMIFRRGR